jgi:hypothetical protein
MALIPILSDLESLPAEARSLIETLAQQAIRLEDKADRLEQEVLLLRQMQAAPKKSPRWKELSDAQAVVIAALIALCPPIISGGIAAITTINFIKRDLDPIEQARLRLLDALPSRPGFSKHVYPAFGFGFLTPASWAIEDAATRFGGGEVDCVKRYEDTKGIVGVKFRMRTVQNNYINHIADEIQNQIDVWKKIDPNLTMGDITINAQEAKSFFYNQPTGKRIGDIRVYWLRLASNVKLEILGFVYTDSSDLAEFRHEFDSIVDSMVFDKQTLETNASKS